MARRKSSSDVTKTGPVGLRGIRNPDLYNFLNSGTEDANIIKAALGSRAATPFTGADNDIMRYYQPTVEENQAWKELGNSAYDKPYMIGNDPSYIQENRAQEQSALVQLGNGLLKGVGLAGTTFLDGTLGLLAGITEGIYNAANGGGWEGFGEGFYNNTISKALREANNMMEEILPNYRTKDEIENPWALRNIFSMNTFADDFLKNMGFTVGAFYSGNAFLGALKGVGLATRMSKTAASTIGSIVSGFNEGRIEAGNLYDEMLTTEMNNLQAARDQAKADLANSPEYQAAGQAIIEEYNQKKAQLEAMPDKMAVGPDGRRVSVKQQALLQLGEEYSTRLSNLEQQTLADIDRRYEQQLKEAQHRAAQAGITDMILNTLYLPAENMFAYGKLYGRKFKPKADLKGRTGEKAIDRAAREEALEETIGKRIAGNVNGYTTNPRSAKKAALRGLGVGFSEGAEEINQATMSSFASNLYQPDSPDTYYKALTNDDYHMETKDAMTAFGEAMVDSWGNTETYKEGLVGFLTGLIGMPTFGRVNNSDANTYLGRGSRIGLSGGILGELSNNRKLNQDAVNAVDAMNKVVQLSADTENFFVRMNSFYDAKAGFSEEKDKFEFNNASDNELFHAIDAFRRSGRMQDLKDIINENFDNISAEDLADIAQNTTGEDNIWSDLDGNSMSATPDGQAKMREILNDRKQEIFEGIESYEKALDEVRSISNESLTDDQTAELAWLKWKVDKFGKRFADIKDKNKDLFTSMSNALINYRDELQNGIDETVEDSEDNIARIELNKTNALIKFISTLQGSQSPMALSAALASRPGMVDYFTETDNPLTGYESFDGQLGISYDQYKRAWEELRDCTRLAKAAKDFDDRYKEFTEDPIKLIKNRDKIDAENAKQTEAKNNLRTRNKIDDASVQDLVKMLDTGDMSDSELQRILNADGDSDVNTERQQKYDNATAILKRAAEIEDKLNELANDPNIDKQAIEDAKAQLEKQKYLVDNAEQLADTSTEAMNTLEMSEEDVQIAMAAGQAAEDAMAQRVDGAKALIKVAEQKLEESESALANMPTETPQSFDTEAAMEAAEKAEGQLDDNSGHDGGTPVLPVNNPIPQEGPAPTSYYNLAYTDIKALMPNVSEDIATNAANTLARVYANIDSMHREGTLAKNSGVLFEAGDNFKATGRLIGDNNTRLLLAKRIDKVLANDNTQQPKSDPTPVIKQDPVTPDISNVNAIEKQIDAEASRSPEELAREDSYNYWKRTTTQFFIHSARAAWQKTIDWIRTQGKSQQQVRRTEAVYKFLEESHAWDNINAGAVSITGKKGPVIRFITSKKLNEDAGEFVVLMVDSQGRIVGDLGSKNDIGTHRQVGLVDYLDAAEKEFNEKKDKTDSDIVTLSGETTVLQNLIGRVDYSPKDQRRSLNEIWKDKPGGFKLALARQSGPNSGMRTNSLSLSATGGSDDMGDKTLSPLNAVAGQPYVLVETSDPARKYVPVPFSMPVFSETTANSMLGQAILKVLQTLPQEDFRTIKDPLKDLLAVDKVSVSFGTPEEPNILRLAIMKNGQWINIRVAKDSPTLVQDVFTRLASKGIPFHVNRKYINRVYDPTGVSYNRMIGELAQTNLNSTHTVGDWFTVSPIGAQGTKIKSTRVNPETATRQAAETIANRSGNTINVEKNGFTYTVDTNTWKAYNSQGTELTGGFAIQVVATAQCLFNGYDITQPGPYEIPLGWYNPVTGALNKQAPRQQSVSKDEEAAEHIKDSIAGIGEALQENFAKGAAETRERDLNKWLQNPKVRDAFKQYASGATSIEEVVNKALAETTNEDAKIALQHLLRFDSTKNAVQRIIDEVNQPSTKQPQIQHPVDNTAKMAEIIGGDTDLQGIWDQMTDEQKQTLASKSTKKIEQILESIKTEAWDGSNITGNVDEYLGARFSRVSERLYSKKWNEKKEKAWLQQVLPQFSGHRLQVLRENFIQISSSDNPTYAYGMFKNGIITLGNAAAKGTLYHEAFHAVTWSIFNADERKQMFDAAREHYKIENPIALEEALAEDFRRYIQLEELPVVGKLVRFFRTLRQFIRSLTGRENYLDKVFYSISRGTYANREVRDTNTVRLNKPTAEEEKIDPNNPDIRYRLVDNEIAEVQHEIDLANQEIKKVSDNWSKAKKIAHRGKRTREGKTTYYAVGGAFNNEVEAREYINRNIPEELRGFFYVRQYKESTYVYYTEKHANDNYVKEASPSVEARKDAESRLLELQRTRDTRISDEALESQADYEQKVKQYYRDKLELGNLSDEQREYLKMRGITDEEYKNMDTFEREVLFECMGI